jgi:hypothetical protein
MGIFILILGLRITLMLNGTAGIDALRIAHALQNTYNTPTSVTTLS